MCPRLLGFLPVWLAPARDPLLSPLAASPPLWLSSSPCSEVWDDSQFIHIDLSLLLAPTMAHPCPGGRCCLCPEAVACVFGDGPTYSPHVHSLEFLGFLLTVSARTECRVRLCFSSLHWTQSPSRGPTALIRCVFSAYVTPGSLKEGGR